MKISIALSGGAARGAFHLGVLEALDEKGFQIEAISGSSIGSIVGASYACGISPKEQLDFFCSKEFKKIIKFNYFKHSLLKIDEKNSILKEIMPAKNLEDVKIKTYITTIDLVSGKIVRFDKGDSIALCLASSALMPLFKPIEYKNYKLADGGIMDNLPIEPLKKHNLPIFGVDLHPNESNFKDTMSGILKRMIVLAWRANVQKNINECDLYITNQKLSNYSLFKFKHLEDMFDLGYETTMLITSKD